MLIDAIGKSRMYRRRWAIVAKEMLEARASNDAQACDGWNDPAMGKGPRGERIYFPVARVLVGRPYGRVAPARPV